MSREWKPGDVAMVQNEYGIWNAAILQVQPGGRKWVYGVAYADAPTDWPVRPLVVIDPESDEDVERIADAIVLHESGGLYNIASGESLDSLRAALREFASPTPERPEEPTGLGAVVEDEDGSLLVRVNDSDHPWQVVGGGSIWHWDAINAPTVLNEGWSA